MGDAEALSRLPLSAVPPGSCELRLWWQLAALKASQALPHWPPPRGDRLVLDLKPRRSAPQCPARVFSRSIVETHCRFQGSCETCAGLARLHRLTERWQNLHKAALALHQTSRPERDSFTVLVRSCLSGERALPTVSIVMDSSCSAASAIAAFALRAEASRRWPRCAACRAARHCGTHLSQLAEQLLPAAVPQDTCRLQLWDGLVRFEADTSLEHLAKAQAPRCLIVVAKLDPKAPPCLGPDACTRCAQAADQSKCAAAWRRRRHFWRRKRSVFALRLLRAEPICPLVTFLRGRCPEEAFRIIVMFL